MAEQQPPFNYAKWQHEMNRQDAQRAHDVNTDFHTYVNKAAMDTANLTLRTLIVINGGAAIAVLTFLGGVAAKERIDFTRVGVVAGTLRWFAFGVAMAVVGLALSYLTQFAMTGVANAMLKTYEHPYVSKGPNYGRWRAWNIFFHIAAVGAALASLLLFLNGMFQASHAITHLLAKP